MSTRSRNTRSTTITTTALAMRTRKMQQEETQLNPSQETDGDAKMNGHEDQDDAKHNIATADLSVKFSSPFPTLPKKRGRKRRGHAEEMKRIDCSCARGDDGSPMILCSECRIWYHFTCVDLSEPDAEEINVFVCPSCSKVTGRRTAMHWEGSQSVEECPADHSVIKGRRKAIFKAQKSSNKEIKRSGPGEQNHAVLELEEDSEDLEDSEDEYVGDEGGLENLGKRRLSRLRRASTTSVDDYDLTDDVSGGVVKRRRLGRTRPSPSSSPAPSHHLKRKAANAPGGRGTSPPPPKRKKSTNASSLADDPARKYCLGKMEEIFKGVFVKYPHVRLSKDETSDELPEFVAKKPEDLTDEEKETLIEEAKRFAHELENCVFEIYAEPDKFNNPHAGPKYKDRFRTLQFNLSKPDRVVIHQRITAGTLSAKEISTMSSTDLADEETKQSIKLAEKEALEHSILKKQTAPRAKITHKGLQDIEDVRGDTTSTRELDLQKEREQLEEEQRERERLVRLRTHNAQRQRTASLSVPPESPTIQHQVPAGILENDDGQPQPDQSWGGPPPIPLHAIMPSPGDSQRAGTPIHPSADHMAADVAPSEPELNLADVINIDEDQEVGAGPALAVLTDAPAAQPPLVASPVDSTFPETGISPFAPRQDRPRVPSFDLNALWSAKNQENTVQSQVMKEADVTTDVPVEAPREESDKDDNMELESVEANDQDFDMILAEETPPTEEIKIPKPPVIEELPQVWNGKITMPLDSTVPQEATLIAKQVGGKALLADSPLWRTLFPTNTLRIEGRVPVENSNKYLLQMRMNPSKELYSAIFMPASPENEPDFKAFNDFLISKNRHGLIFPWGSRPKEYHPGRELYMIPLIQSEVLPEFVELLDDLKLPKVRSRDYLVGVWILNKGKLAPLPGHPPPVTVPTQPQSAPIHSPTVPPPVPSNRSPLAPAVPLRAANMPVVPPAGVLPIPNPSALAAEVASLTPEQIQSVLRSLASTSQLALGPPLQPGPPLSLGVPTIPQLTSQPWMAPGPHVSAPPYPSYPPTNVPFQPGIPSNQYNSDRTEFDRPGPANYDREYGNGHQYDDRDRSRRGGDRGNRGRGVRGAGRGRGRGRGGRDEYEDRDFRPRDSGWPRKPRNDGPSW